ncbi:polysaccharide pyruvyl transferase family protein [Halocella sp. SP3-1]|nr:polysaccharide pyruvyl transferase family protein [Halocella sp. SP3-1]
MTGILIFEGENNLKPICYLSVGLDNLGDKACLEAFLKKLSSLYQGSSVKPDIYQVLWYQFDKLNIQEFSLVVLGGGSLLATSYYLKCLYQAQQVGVPTVIWGSGVDHSDPQFTDDLLAGRAEGVPDIEEFFTKKVKYLLRSTVSQVGLVGVRGPYTLKILQLLDCQLDKVFIAGDSGILLEPDLSRDNNLHLNEKMIMVNWGTSYNKVYGENEEKLAVELAGSLDHLQEEGYQIIIYPVWEQDIPAIFRLVDKMINQDNLIVINRVLPSSQLLWCISQASLSINFKLHPCIFSAAVGVPFISLAYRFKCFDFAESVKCQELCIRTDVCDIKKEILDRVKYIRDNKNTYYNKFLQYKSGFNKKYDFLIEYIDETIKK